MPDTEQVTSTDVEIDAADERLMTLATNRCLRSRWPEAGREWLFNIEGLRSFAQAVLNDARKSGVL
jgi:hypothetical protein